MTLKSPSIVRILGLAFLSLSLPGVFAQRHTAGHIMQMQDEIPPEKLPRPVRMSGIGNAHMEITATPEAQMWFNQGLNLLHDFWEYEAARAFEQGVRVDPQCAMCYWGLYKAESMYHSTAQGYAGRALAQAVALKERATAGSACTSKRLLLTKKPDTVRSPNYSTHENKSFSAKSSRMIQKIYRRASSSRLLVARTHCHA